MVALDMLIKRTGRLLLWWKEDDAIERSNVTTVVSGDAKSAKREAEDILASYRVADMAMEYWRDTHGKDAAHR